MSAKEFSSMRILMKVVTLAALAALVAVAPASARADVPSTISFTGRLSNTGGPVNGSVTLVFDIFDAVTAGHSVWQETHGSVQVSAGLVFADLGGSTTLDATIFDGSDRFLQVTVNGEVLTPRLALGSVPYAIRAGVADQVGDLAAGQVQARVTGTCPAGSSISGIGATGSVTCEADNNTTYTGGAGIAVSATTVSLATTGCAAGSVWKFNGSTFVCSPDADTIYTGGAGIAVSGTTVGLATTGCAAGSVWKFNGSTFVCSPDDDTTYTGGTGISIAGTSIAVDSNVVARKDAAAGNQAFDGTTLVLDYSNNRVGVGTAAPAAPLDVNGNVRATSYSYSTPKTGDYPVAGSAFHPELNFTDEQWLISSFGYGFLSGGTGTPDMEVSAAVILPQGASPTGMTCYLEDTDSAGDFSGTALLRTRAFTATAATTIVTTPISTTGIDVSAITTKTQTSMIAHTVDNSANAYFIDVFFSETPTPVATGNLLFYGCTVSYSYAQVQF
jgi:hypothetical protein